MRRSALAAEKNALGGAARGLDCIYVTASANDARLTRICVASIRHFYPDAPIRLLVGGPLEAGLAQELARNWNVQIADVAPGHWGWGFVKLEPLFGPPGERFLVLDSDTIFCGRALQAWAACEGDFLVDDEQQGEAETHRIYYDWREVAAVHPDALPPQFVFNSGQWFGTSGVLTREDFADLVDWSSLPPKLHRKGLFKNGEQGVINYVFNQKAQLAGLKVSRARIMHWPGFGMDGYSLAEVKAGSSGHRIIHWAGFKSGRLGGMPGADLLRHFEATYYARLPQGSLLRALRRLRYPPQFAWRGLVRKVSHRAAALLQSGRNR
jgi:hypothetical protein